MKVLSVKNIKKSFGKKEVLKDITFSLDRGEVVGFLGRNGAGKSTTMKIICGLLEANLGEVEVCGYHIVKDRVKALENLGVSIESPALYNNLTGRDNLRVMANWRGISKVRIKEMEEYTKLKHNLDRMVGTYSMGMRMRLMLAMVLLAKPKLIVLDEPMNGLDPDGVFELREEMKKLKSEGCSILFSSHQLSEVEKVSDRIVMIEKGKIVYDDKLDRGIIAQNNFLILTNDNEKAKQILEKSRVKIEDVDDVNFKDYVNIKVENMELNTIIDKLRLENVEIRDMEKLHKTLEELYKELIEA